MTLTIRFLPGVPDVFLKTFPIQVAHFEPDVITVNGEGVFPRISLDLPRLPTEDYEELLKSSRGNISFKNKRASIESETVQVFTAGQMSPSKDAIPTAAIVETPSNQV